MLTRPTVYSEEVAENIFHRFLDSDLTLEELCAKHDDLPTYRTILVWLKHSPQFLRSYAILMDCAQEMVAEELTVVARGLPMDMYIDDKFKIRSTPGAIRHTKAVIRHKRWLLERRVPKKYLWYGKP